MFGISTEEVVVSFFIFGLFILIIFLVVRGIASFFSAITGGRHRAYRQLARRHRGIFEPRGLVDPPTVSFGYRDSRVRVGLAPVIAGQSSAPRTRVVARFGSSLPFRFELFPSTRQAPRQPPRGTRLVHVGTPEIDHHYVIRANDTEVASELLLEPEAQVALQEIRRISPPSGMLVSINPERLLVQVDRNLGSNFGVLDLAVNRTLQLHDLVRQHVSERMSVGISIVEAEVKMLQPDGPVLCKVCNEPITSRRDRVTCVTCHAPHHRDCWAFVGGCSIYGCLEKQCRPA